MSKKCFLRSISCLKRTTQNEYYTCTCDCKIWGFVDRPMLFVMFNLYKTQSYISSSISPIMQKGKQLKATIKHACRQDLSSIPPKYSGGGGGMRRGLARKAIYSSFFLSLNLAAPVQYLRAPVAFLTIRKLLV